jgi:hypothetical protein
LGENYRRTAALADRVLKEARPATRAKELEDLLSLN